MTASGITLQVRPAAGGEPPVSVIVPLPEGADAPAALLDQLPADFEIVLARGGSRASAMNAGAMRATASHLWFVHADTLLGPDAVVRQRKAAASRQDQISYCAIRFDGGGVMHLTDLGVLFRSRVLGLPFGDQALAMPAALFQRLGGYREDAPYGEDHLLVWRAHQTGVPVLPIGAVIGTSALKYRTQGWLRMTLRHVGLTIRQAWPEWRAMRRAARRRARSAADRRAAAWPAGLFSPTGARSPSPCRDGRPDRHSR
jgi:hypothetical protein